MYYYNSNKKFEDIKSLLCTQVDKRIAFALGSIPDGNIISTNSQREQHTI